MSKNNTPHVGRKDRKPGWNSLHRDGSAKPQVNRITPMSDKILPISEFQLELTRLSSK